MAELNSSNGTDDAAQSIQRRASIKKNSVYNAIKTLLTIVFPLITFPYASRTLGAECIGKVSFSASIISYFSLLATLGITAYAVRECSKVKHNKDELGKLAGQLISINIITTALSYCILILCLIVAVSLREYQLLISIQSISILLSAVGADWLNTAMEDFRYITLRTFAMQLISVALLLTCVHTPSDYINYTIITLISSSGANLLNVFYRRKYCKVKLTVAIEWSKHLPPILTLFAMLLSQNVLNNLDITMLGFMMGDRAVGLYSTAVKITNIATQLVVSITWVVMPQLSAGFEKEDYDTINRVLHKAAVFTAALGIPLLVGVNMMAREAILVVGGEEYLDAVPCLRLLSINMALFFTYNIYGNMILLPSGNERLFLRACIVSAFVNAISNIILIPIWGLNGASVATAISGVIIAVMTIVTSDNRARITNIHDIILAPISGGVLVIIVCAICRLLFNNYIICLTVAILGSAVVYAVVLVLLKNDFAVAIINPLVNSLKRKVDC